MPNFTNSPFEKMMKQIPRPRRDAMREPLPGSDCNGCSFWQGTACVGLCYRALTSQRKGGAATSGQLGPK
ncbi:MAG: hypothetical protein LBI55_02465, partial [Oscillospiraceae bacterium]|nr:hypothetical protein [Oscillospiraceae bacterium]